MTLYESRWKEQHLPCPCGESSDAYSINKDGSGKCFSCDKYFPSKFEGVSELDGEVVKKYTSHRGISTRTFEKYKASTKYLDGIPVEVGFPYSEEPASIKIRNLAEKKFAWKGDGRTPRIFGKNSFDKGSKRVITITEGEFDALAAYDILREESACISVRSSSSAFVDCKAEYDYINSFEKIIINFDNDGPGQSAAQKVATLFDFKKVYNLVLQQHKDANGYIWDNDTGEAIDNRKEYHEAWRGVKRHTPDNIVSGYDSFAKALAEKREGALCTYPFSDLQSKLYGLHRGEVVVLLAEEGVGKTEVFRVLEDHVLKTTKSNIGIIHLEEDNGTTLRGLAAYFAEIPSHVPDSPISEEEVLEVIKEATRGSEERLFLRSAFDVEDEDSFIDNIRFLVSGCGCDFIFFDHVSWLATGGDDQDERKKLDRITQRLKLLAKELRFCLIMISHVNDDGKPRGSRNITKVANTVIRLKRDKLHRMYSLDITLLGSMFQHLKEYWALRLRQSCMTPLHSLGTYIPL